jgi:hypothetical protein
LIGFFTIIRNTIGSHIEKEVTNILEKMNREIPIPPAPKKNYTLQFDHEKWEWVFFPKEPTEYPRSEWNNIFRELMLD